MENEGLPVKGKRSAAVPGRAAKPPVKGYQPQSDEAVALVNANKVTEEKLLRPGGFAALPGTASRCLPLMDALKGCSDIDQRWLAIARTQFEQGFMALNRAIFKPGRIDLDEDEAAA